MKLSLTQALQKAIDAQKAGRTAEAEQLYLAIFQVHPTHPAANFNMGMFRVSFNKLQEALPFFKTAHEAKPANAQFVWGYVVALVKVGHLADAKNVFTQAKDNGVESDALDQLGQQLNKLDNAQPGEYTIANFRTVKAPPSLEPPQALLQALIKLYSQGHYQQALDQAAQILFQFPRSFNLHNIQGASNSGLHQFDAAIESYKKAIKIKPKDADTYNNMGITLNHNGEIDAAIESFKQAIKINPKYADAYLNMGIILKDKGELDAAIKSFKQAININPKDASVYLNMGITLKDKGELDAAIKSFKEALKINPNYSELYLNIGVAHRDKGEIEAAIDSYKRAIEIKPDFSDAYLNLGNVLQEKGDFESAVESYNQAVNIKPSNVEAHRILSTIKKYKYRDKQYVQMESLHADPNIADENLCSLCFGLAKATEDLGAIGESFKYLQQGNTLRKKILGYSITHNEKLFGDIKHAHSTITLNSIQVIKKSTEPTPIFILGMPRSGTSLVEQIISSHSKVNGGGELKFASQFGYNIALGETKADKKSLTTFRDRYLSALRKISNDSPFVTDKMPHNFRFVGLIHATFPDAKIIHVKRDAAATCWSSFKHYFTTKGLGYSNNLDDLVKYYGLYESLMSFWNEQLPGRIYNVNYDELTINQEEETRRLIQKLGLDWEDACLSPESNKRTVKTASLLQVRQKVYVDSSQQWRIFEKFLDGKFDNLNPV
jgi:tetratricopeptide (TPR) repeat protein